ncbi:hypothetical protein [Lactiplantibacillus fabifermentans]|nr:hypothetical protein [Lactiplantibacillus fabifermentans]
MDSLLITNYKPDYNNNIMTISFTIKSLAISSESTISMDDFNTAIASGVEAIKELVLNSLITALSAMLPDDTTTTTTEAVSADTTTTTTEATTDDTTTETTTEGATE